MYMYKVKLIIIKVIPNPSHHRGLHQCNVVAVENFVVILPCAFAQLALQFSFLHFTSCIPLFGLVFVSCISLSELCRQEVAMETYLLPRQLLSSPVITFAPPALQY